GSRRHDQCALDARKRQRVHHRAAAQAAIECWSARRRGPSRRCRNRLTESAVTDSPAANPPKARVLFVDDEPRVLTTMRMLFRANYQVFTAEGGAQALEMLKTQPVDVVVSDQRMPGMTGIELLRVARELNPNAMRILLTGYSDLSAIIGSINEGEIFRFVSKPWANEELTTTVARAVAAARASEAAAAAGD